MRLSVNNTGYRKGRRGYEIELDGEEVNDCIMFDEERGYITKLLRNRDGLLSTLTVQLRIGAPWDTVFRTVTKHGSVSLFINGKRVPSTLRNKRWKMKRLLKKAAAFTQKKNKVDLRAGSPTAMGGTRRHWSRHDNGYFGTLFGDGLTDEELADEFSVSVEFVQHKTTELKLICDICKQRKSRHCLQHEEVKNGD